MGLLDLNYKISKQLESIQKEHNGEKLEKLEKTQKELEHKKRIEKITSHIDELLFDTIRNNINKNNYNLYDEESQSTICDSIIEYIKKMYILSNEELAFFRTYINLQYFKILQKVETIEHKRKKVDLEHNKKAIKKINPYNIDGLTSDEIVKKIL